jgi:hypothetical protein
MENNSEKQVTPAWSALLRSSAVLLALQLAAGLLNYLYQVFAARSLSTLDLSQLNSWASVFSLFLVFAAAAQFRAVLAPRDRVASSSRRIGWLTAFSLLLAFSFWIRRSPASPLVWTLMAVLTWAAVAMFHHLLGTLQRRKAFWLMGLAGLTYALTRATGAASAHTVHEFISIWLTAASCGAIAALGLSAWSVFQESATNGSEKKLSGFTSMTIALLPGVSIAWLPSYDFFAVQLALGSEAGGHFTRLQLFSKILFFAPLTLAQISLPYYAEAFRTKASSEVFSKLRRLEAAGLGISYLGAITLGFIGPVIGARILGLPEVLLGTDVMLACLNITPLYGVLCAVQTFASAGRTREPIAALLASVCAFGITVVASRYFSLSLTGLLALSATLNTMVGVGCWLQVRRMLKSV